MAAAGTCGDRSAMRTGLGLVGHHDTTTHDDTASPTGFGDRTTHEGMPMSSDLTGSVALVTGGTSGIGRASAARLATLGAHVIITGRDTARGEHAVATIRADGGKADFAAASLVDEPSARGLARKAIELGGGQVDILVNNAGIFPFGATDSHTEADFDRVYAINVKVPFFLVAELAPAMAARGKGAIINVTTGAAQIGLSGMALYGSSKAALVLLTKAWAAEYGPSGVRVNAVSPGPTRTEGTAPMGDALDQFAATTPHGRPGMPDDIATAIGYLASDEAAYVHGAVLAVDGGHLAV
jgi:NAD(P)-dependent dehydrogenase (short-subunit alcohol dehydrogenase family)